MRTSKSCVKWIVLSLVKGEREKVGSRGGPGKGDNCNYTSAFIFDEMETTEACGLR
jgi:hypothetical protein